MAILFRGTFNIDGVIQALNATVREHHASIAHAYIGVVSAFPDVEQIPSGISGPRRDTRHRMAESRFNRQPAQGVVDSNRVVMCGLLCRRIRTQPEGRQADQECSQIRAVFCHFEFCRPSSGGANYAAVARNRWNWSL